MTDLTTTARRSQFCDRRGLHARERERERERVRERLLHRERTAQHPMLRRVCIGALAASARGDLVDLDAKTFDDAVFGPGKAAFIKFQAPW